MKPYRWCLRACDKAPAHSEGDLAILDGRGGVGVLDASGRLIVDFDGFAGDGGRAVSSELGGEGDLFTDGEGGGGGSDRDRGWRWCWRCGLLPIRC